MHYRALCLYLRYPQGTAHMDPLASTAGGLHGSTFLRAELAFRWDAQRACPTQPAAFWNLQDAITRLQKKAWHYSYTHANKHTHTVQTQTQSVTKCSLRLSARTHIHTHLHLLHPMHTYWLAYGWHTLSLTQHIMSLRHIVPQISGWGCLCLCLIASNGFVLLLKYGIKM